ncbi:IS701 family transposase [Actinophytocola oryzae]|uniref:SRSO17 transposase n=1 Tax=Actinophytocola oryzae TaxID=502181 RepID=A0A4R7VFD0_9PSEU|nr:transposase [Actinophytocola oryzae]TDV47795.1 SRSO17 transposase [Actinophytocola oryzae]
MGRTTLDELCEVVFASLPRADQRARGAAYLRGLLAAPGRKSIRNIAAASGGPEQGLHHFVSDSTWPWVPVRRALAGFVAARVEPSALVVRTMVVPKAGKESVGVGRRFDAALGKTFNAQQAVGVWVASERVSSPVAWRLHLSRTWLADDRRGAETVGECAVAALREVPRRLARPVVLDARATPAAATVRGLARAGVAFVVRVDTTLRLSVPGPVLPGHESVPADWPMAAVRDLRRRVGWVDVTGVPRTVLAAVVPVTLPGAGALRLLGVADRGAWPEELWLTNLPAPPATVLRLARLTGRVDHDRAEIADRVGIRDYAGRSFAGWHRHVTLASAAHAVVAVAPRMRLAS